MSENAQSDDQEGGSNGIMVFDGLLDITMVAKYYEQLNELLNDQKMITLNMENVERVDGAGLQLILAFLKEAEKLNLEVSWSGVSEVFDSAAKTIALNEGLNYAV